MIKKSILVGLVILGLSCASKGDGTQTFLSLEVKECFYSVENPARICLDSVFNDSRCPTGYECVWEWDATAAFTLTKNKNVETFNLHLNDKFQNDTLIEGMHIKLLHISPYPEADRPINSKNYSVEISVDEN